MDGILHGQEFLLEFQGHHQNHSLFIYNVAEWETTRKADSTAIFKKGDRCELVIIGHSVVLPSRYYKTLNQEWTVWLFWEGGSEADFNLSFSFKGVKENVL